MNDAELARLMMPHLRALLDLCERAAAGNTEQIRSKVQGMMRPSEGAAKIKDLRKAIIAALGASPNQTTGELAAALFDPEWGISLDLFKRRVIVHVSAMHRRKDLWTYKPEGAKETRWHLNERRYPPTQTDDQK